MSAKLPFFKFDAAAWLTGKVQLLTPAEKGIFIDLLARMWHENGALKNTEFLHRQIRCEKIELSNALKTFAELSIMEENDGVLSVKFIGEQLSENNAYREVRRACGAKGGRPKKVGKPKKKEERRIFKETPPDGGEKKAVPAPTLPISREQYPQSVDEVLAIAEDPRCAVQITREQAEAYFLARDTADWIDAARRRISPGKIYGDLRRWALRDQSKGGRAAASDAVPEVTLPAGTWEE